MCLSRKTVCQKKPGQDWHRGSCLCYKVVCLSRSPCIPTATWPAAIPLKFLAAWSEEREARQTSKPGVPSPPAPPPPLPRGNHTQHFQPHHYNWLLKTPRNIITMWILLPNNRSFSKKEEERNIEWAAEIHMLMMTLSSLCFFTLRK